MAEWNPGDLSPEFWWDISDNSTLYDAISGGTNTTTGDVVLRAEDKSGNAVHLIGGNGALHTDGVLYGNTVLEFDGTASPNYHMAALTPTGMLGNDAKTLVFVLRPRNGNPGILFGTTNDFVVANQSRGYWMEVNGTTLLCRHYASGDAIVTNAFESTLAHHIVICTVTASDAVTPPDVVWYVDGNELTLTTDTITYLNATYTELGSGYTAVGNLNLGGAVYYSNPLLGEIAGFSSVLSDANRQKLEGYLSYKWGVPLVSGHPYRYKHQYGGPCSGGAAGGMR